MQHILNTQIALDEVDLVTPTTTQKYKLGEVIEVVEKAATSSETASYAVKKYMYVKSHTTLTAFQPYIIAFSSTAGSEVITAAPLTLTAPGSLICVPQVAFTSGYYGFVQIQGDCSVLMTAETYAVGDYLQVLTAGTATVVDGSTGSTVVTTASMGICKTAGTTAVARSAYLLGAKAVVASA